MEDQRPSRTWKFLAGLSAPAFGLALAYTVATTYLPLLIERVSGPGLTGLIIGSEGVLALTVPVLVGSWSDSTDTRFGSRVPFVLAGAGLSVLGLLALPLAVGSLLWIAVALMFFLCGYFVYYSPYYAMFPDFVPDSERGRSQGMQGIFRSAGLLLALATGGVLLHWWEPLPFVLGALAVVASTAFLYRMTRGRGAGSPRSDGYRGYGFAHQWSLLRRYPDIRRWAVANALWETALAALRVFVVLYFTRGLGMSLPKTSGALALVGVAAIGAAPVSGAMADRFGHRPVMLTALWLFAIGLVPAMVTTNTAFIILIVPVTFAAVVLLTLPYSVLMGLLPEREDHGEGAGLFGMSRGMGVLIGPLLAGGAVHIGQFVPVLAFADTRGYAAIFVVASLALLASIPVLSRMRTSREAMS